MCGICGIYNYATQAPASPDLLRGMTTTLRHRGPDDAGYHVEGAVGLGMRRLRIIDLEGGVQPMSNEDQSVWVIFNGEIYNHNELRAELEWRGHRFRTVSDTEAIVHAYEEDGPDCVHRFNGMFAFAVWDRRRRLLLLARDRLGIKPLYYGLNADGIVFGSELKPILLHRGVPPEIDFSALDAYLTLEYIPSPLSIAAGVRKLPAGHLLVIGNGRPALHRYWDVPRRTVEAPPDEMAERLLALLRTSVKRRLLSDVPLGVLLSGGMDSSTVATLMSTVTQEPIKTFSIGFEDASYNELGYARAVARHIQADHHELIIRPDAVRLAEGLLAYLDEPMADVSVFPTFLVSQLARRQVTVALTGDGGDELFAGYDHYIAHRLATAYSLLPGPIRHGMIEPLLRSCPPSREKKGMVNRLKRFVEGLQHPADLAHARWMVFLSAGLRGALYSPELAARCASSDAYAHVLQYLDGNGRGARLEDQLYADLKTYLVDDILVKVDRMSMAVSLEARVPFLDYEVVEFAATIPARWKLRGFRRKYILRKAVGHLLPPEILTRGKEGFSIPMKNWLRGELRPMMLDLLSPDRLRRQGWFNPDFVEGRITEHLQERANHSHHLWPLMVFQLWCDRYLDATAYRRSGEGETALRPEPLTLPGRPATSGRARS
jgi:asparagine synthase (glutamine-hydrolysing)